LEVCDVCNCTFPCVSQLTIVSFILASCMVVLLFHVLPELWSNSLRGSALGIWSSTMPLGDSMVMIMIRPCLAWLRFLLQCVEEPEPIKLKIVGLFGC
jgi:sugar phosphate permease